MVVLVISFVLCSHAGQGTMSFATGLEHVIDATIEVLPMVARGAFISAQSISFVTKEQRAKHIITEFATGV